MRTIKFRAWDKKRRLMLLVENLFWFHPVGKVLNKGISAVTCAEINGYERTSDIQAGDSVIMQYTGLKDKNGREIFEGDIVKTWHIFSKLDYNKDKQEDFCTGVWICKWETPKIMFNPNDKRCIGRMTTVTDELSEIIGNIYENKELLK